MHDESQRAFSFDVHNEHLLQLAKDAVALAEDLEARADPSAEGALKEAARLTDLAADEDLQLSLNRAFGRHYARRKMFHPAREHFGKAERTAQVLGLHESVAQLQLLIAGVDIANSRDNLKIGFFQNLRQASGKDGSYSWQIRRDVWFQFVDDCNARDGRVAARKFGSIEDFRARLEQDAERWTRERSC